MAKQEIQRRTAGSSVDSKLQRLPHGFLKYCQTTIELAKQKVAGWLNDYMLHKPAASKRAAIVGRQQRTQTHGRPSVLDWHTKD